MTYYMYAEADEFASSGVSGGGVLKNTVTAPGFTQDTEVVVLPETGLKFGKTVARRVTKNMSGSLGTITGVDNDIFDEGSLNSSYGNPAFSDYPSGNVNAVLEMNAGDRIEFDLTLENGDNVAHTVTVDDIIPFTPSTTYFNPYNDITGWKYYAQGNSRHLESYSSGSATVTSGTLSGIYGQMFDEFEKNNTSSETYYVSQHSVTSGRGATWELTIPAKTTYKQTVVLVVPGDNTKPSEHQDNGGFQELVYQFRQQVGSNSSRYSDPSSFEGNNLKSVAYCTYAGDDKEVNSYSKNIGGKNSTQYPITFRHNVAREAFVSTGVIATPVLSSGIGSVNYPNPGNSEIEKDQTRFEIRPDQYIYNYVLIYNESCQPLNLDDVDIEVFIPVGFEFAGLVSGNSSSMSPPSSSASVIEDCNQGNLMPWISAGSAYAADERNEPFYYRGIYQNGISFSYSGSTGSVKLNPNGSGAEISPYKAILIFYAAKVSDVNTANKLYGQNDSYASFSARIKFKNGQTTCQPTTSVEVKDNYSSTKSYNFFGNIGLVSSCLAYNNYQINYEKSGNPVNGDFEKYYNGSTWESTVNGKKATPFRQVHSGGTGSDWGYGWSGEKYPQSLWSNVSLYAKSDLVSFELDKIVRRNFGSTTTDHEPNSGYSYNYVPHDGIHRTVDGTVWWDMKIKNTGRNVSSDGSAYDVICAGLNYGIMVDTVDMPYQLSKLQLGDFWYKLTTKDGEQYLRTSFGSNGYLIENIPWSNSEGNRVAVIDIPVTWQNAGGAPSDIVTNSVSLRITAKTIENGSIAYGADRNNSARPQNQNATQYVIEFASYTSADGISTFMPSIPPHEAAEPGMTEEELHTFDLSLCFKTDDSIITNYNSFGIMIPDFPEDRIRNSGDDEKKSVLHNGAGTSSASILMNEPEIMTASTMSLLGESDPGANGDEPSPIAERTRSFALDGIDLDPSRYPYYEYSDWTDTSYTDGMKTVEVLDKKGGSAVQSLNSRSDGDMTLPDTVIAGDWIRTSLMVESILHEAENYSAIQDLNIYDVFGVQDSADGMGSRSPYSVDFSTVTVRDSLGHTLVPGADYEIYYTFDDFVTKEHHPISPVNTLYYAADPNLVSAGWIKYDPENGATGVLTETDALGNVTVKYARGIRIQLKNEYANILNPNMPNRTGKSGITSAGYNLTVQFESQVIPEAFDGITVKTYPNVLAYDANIPDISERTNKHIFEDTTAILTKADAKKGLFIRKSVVDGEDNDLSEKLADVNYRFGIIRWSSTSYTNQNYIAGVAVVDAAPGKYSTESDIKIIYDKNGTLTKENFFNSSYPFWIFELPEDKAGSELSFVPGDIFYARQDKSTTKNAITISKEKLTGISDSDIVLKPGEYFNFTPNSSGGTGSFSVEVTAVNKITKTAVKLKKVETAAAGAEKVLIKRRVVFKLESLDGTASEVMRFVYDEEAGEYVFSKSPEASEEIVLTEGTVNITGLAPGKYRFTEIEAPEGYIAGAPTEFTLKNSDSEYPVIVEIENEPDGSAGSGTVKIIKTDEKGREIAFDSAKFEIYSEASVDSDGNLLAGAKPLAFTENDDSYSPAKPGETGITVLGTKDGALKLTGLELKSEGVTVYYAVEASSPSGYKYDPVPIKLELSKAVSETEVKAVNTGDYGSLKIEKTDIAGNIITKGAAEFELYLAKSFDASGNVIDGAKPLCFSGTAGNYVFEPGNGETSIFTLKGSLFIKDLPIGEYVIREITPPAGYMLSDSTVSATVESKTEEDIKIENSPVSVKLSVRKFWKMSEDSPSDYQMAGATFSLFVKDADGNLEFAEQKTTDARGIITFDREIDWFGEEYYLYEHADSKSGYELLGTEPDPYYIERGADNRIVKLWASSGAGHTDPAKVVKVDFEDLEDARTEEGGWVFGVKLININSQAVSNMLNSFSYKKIDNHIIAEEYGIEPEEGYSFFYSEDDYTQGNKNYVHALIPGDIVTYSLVVKNMSDVRFDSLRIIDVMPDSGDTGVLNSYEKRNSHFKVANINTPFTVVIEDENGVPVTLEPKTDYKVEFSDKTKFSDDDFDGLNTDGAWRSDISLDHPVSDWRNASEIDCKSFRVVLDDSVTLYPDRTVTVIYNGIISGEAMPETDENIIADKNNASIAWNNFAYRYSEASSVPGKAVIRTIEMTNQPSSGVATIASSSSFDSRTPEPLKVGVITKRTAADLGAYKELEIDSDSIDTNGAEHNFNFMLEYLGYEGTSSDPDVQVGIEADDDITAEKLEYGGTRNYSVTVPEGGSIENVLESAKTVWFTQPGTYTFRLFESPAPAGSAWEYFCDKSVYEITVNVDVDDFKNSVVDKNYRISDVTYKKITDENGKTVSEPVEDKNPGFKNTVLSYGSLEFSKTVEASSLGTSPEFTFTLSLTKLDSLSAHYTEPIKYTLTRKNGSVEAGEIEVATGNTEFKLGDGDSVLAEHIPAGVEYEITEDADGFDSEPSGDVFGKIAGGKKNTAGFTNSFKTGELTVSKTFAASPSVPDEFKDLDFDFTVTLHHDKYQLAYDEAAGEVAAAVPVSGNPEDCVFSLTIKAGESKVIKNIPIGTTYKVVEAENPMFKSDGTVEEFKEFTETSSETVTNTFNAGKIRIVKKVENLPKNDLLGKEAESLFTLRARFTDGEDVLKSAIEVTGSGYSAPTKLVPDSDGWYSFTLSEDGYIEFDYLPVGYVCEISEQGAEQYSQKLEVSDNGTLTDGKTADIAAGETVTATLTNTYKAGALRIKKTVVNPEQGGDTEQEFTFKAVISRADGEAFKSDLEPTVTDTVGDRSDPEAVVFDEKTGEYTVKLRHGDELYFPFIPDGFGYSITETEDTRYSFTTETTAENYNGTPYNGSDASDSIITDKVEKTCEFLNRYEIGTVLISKEVTDSATSYVDYKHDPDRSFEFILTLTRSDGSSEPVSFGAYRFEKGEDIPDTLPDKADEEVEFTLNDGVLSASVSLKDGERLKLINVPKNWRITAEEIPDERYDGYVSESIDGVESDGTAVSGKELEIKAMNALEVGSLSLKKSAVGGAPDDIFTFEIALTLEGEPLKEEYSYTISKSGTVVSSGKVIGSKAKITVQRDEEIRIVGLPAGTVAKIVEISHGDYTSDKENDTDTLVVVKDSTVSSEFVNDFNVSSLTVKKTVTADIPENISSTAEFGFTVVLESSTYHLEAVKTYDRSYRIVSSKLTASDGGKSEAVIKFILRHGESAVISDIPDGTAYKVTEDDTYGYTCSEPTVEGKIVYDVPASEEFINHHEVGKISVSKEVIGDIMKWTESFGFTLALANPDGTDLENGTFRMVKQGGEPEKFSLEGGKFSFELAPGESIEFTDIPLGTAYTLTEDSDRHFTSLVNGVETDEVSGKIEKAGERIEIPFVNDMNVGKISISKTLSGTGGLKDAEAGKTYVFTLTVKTDDDTPLAGEYPYSITGGESGTVVLNEQGMCEITLKHGQEIVIENIPAYSRFTVSEQNFGEYSVTVNGMHVNDGNSGEIEVSKDKTASARFVNYREALGSLKITKSVTVGSFREYFTFRIYLRNADGKLANVNGIFGDMIFTKGTAEIHLGHGMSATATGLPADLFYTVEELTPWGYMCGSTGASGMITDYGYAQADFVNTIRTGSLTISKRVASENPDPDRSFAFKVYLTDVMGYPITGSFRYAGSGSGTISSGDTVYLKDGGEIVIYGLPFGVTYSVSEEASEGYFTEASGDHGTIGAATSSAEFVNSFIEDQEIPEQAGSSEFENEDVATDSSTAAAELTIKLVAILLIASLTVAAVLRKNEGK